MVAIKYIFGAILAVIIFKLVGFGLMFGLLKLSAAIG